MSPTIRGSIEPLPTSSGTPGGGAVGASRLIGASDKVSLLASAISTVGATVDSAEVDALVGSDVGNGSGVRVGKGVKVGVAVGGSAVGGGGGVVVGKSVEPPVTSGVSL